MTTSKLFKNNLAVFATLYLTALWLEMAENWEHPELTLVILVLLLAIIFTGINKLKFCLFIIATTAYFLYFHFPEVANHVNLIIFSNIALVIVAIYSWLRSNQFTADDDYYLAIQPIIRIALIIVYFWAGFHKLNRDFFISQYTCSNSMLTGIIEMLFSSAFGIPVIIIFIAIAYLFVRQTLPSRKWNLLKQFIKRFLVVGLLFSLATVVAIALVWYFDLAGSIKALLILATSIIVVIWEIVGSILLLIPSWQISVFLFSLLMHLVLAPIGFVDFGSLAMALWVTFIPENYYTLLNKSVKISLVKLRISRCLLYVLINVLGGIISGIYYLAYPNFNLDAIAGIIFIISVLVIIRPLITKLLIAPNSWQGVQVTNGKMPKFMYIFLAVIFLYGATPYLGLRTAGNFSMFSNLRTEGAISNHLLLGNNLLKIWNYQEDVVKFIEIDDEKAKIGHKYRPLKDHYLPVVEFRKLIHKWTKAGYKVPLIFEYNNKIYTTPDIVNDPMWRTSQRNWEMILMDFRVIQPNNGEPNYCRW